jgi:hypothetical protein
MLGLHFGGEGDGVKIIGPYDWQINTEYMFSIFCVERDGIKYIHRYFYTISTSGKIDWRCLGITSTPLPIPNNSILLSSGSGTFIEDFGDTTIDGSFYDNIELSGRWVKNINEWIPLSRIDYSCTTSILDPANDLYDIKKTDENNLIFELSHGMDVTSNPIKISEASNSFGFNTTGDVYGSINNAGLFNKYKSFDISSNHYYNSNQLYIPPISLVQPLNVVFKYVVKTHNNYICIKWISNNPFYKYEIYLKEKISNNIVYTHIVTEAGCTSDYMIL